MRIAVCDDLATDRAKLGGLLEKYCREHSIKLVLDTFENGEEFLAGFTAGKYQLIFFDVYMGGISGVDAARRVRQTDSDCALVFTTTSSDYAIDSFEVRASDYLVKPYGETELSEAMDWCVQNITQSVRSIELISNRERINVAIKDIIYVEVTARVSVVHTEGAEVSTNRGLSDIEAEIADEDFLRCHRSFLVNMNHIRRPDKADFIMTNGERVPIGTDNLAKIKQAFFDWSFKRAWEGR